MGLRCCVCEQSMEPNGALLFSPPREDKVVVKEHVCTLCWQMIVVWLGNMRNILRQPPIV